MKTIVRTHPLKDIILEFDETKTPPEFEKEALKRYYEAHDVVWGLKQRLDYLANGLIDAQRQTSERYTEIMALEQSLEFVEDSLGLIDGSELPQIENEFSINVSDLFQDIENHSQALQELYVLVDDLTQRYNYEVELRDPADEWQEHWPVHGSYFGLFDEVYPRYEELSVDIVSLDDDEQQFLTIYGELDDNYHNNLTFAEEVFGFYARLVERADALYHRTSVAVAVFKRDILGNFEGGQ